MTNQPNVGEVICEVCWRSNVCNATDSYIDCYFHQKNILNECDKLQKALTKLTEIVERCFYHTDSNGNSIVVGISATLKKLNESGFPLSNKGGE